MRTTWNKVGAVMMVAGILGICAVTIATAPAGGQMIAAGFLGSLLVAMLGVTLAA